MNLANNSGTFASGNFINLEKAGSSVFSVNSLGNVKVTLTSSTHNYAICHDTNGTGLDTLEDCSGTPGADFQENYPAAQDVSWGDVLTASTTEASTTNGNNLSILDKSTQGYDQSIIGVASNPADSGDFNTIGYNLAAGTNPFPVALNGRVMVKISLENGDIAIGDYLTSSITKPGYAMKATHSGYILGVALDNFNASSTSAVTSTSTGGTVVSEPAVMMFVRTGFQNINNIFVLGEDDGQLASATSTPSLDQMASSSLADSFLIDQAGTGNILDLQSAGQDRLLIANDGSFNLLASTTIATSTILTVSNGTTTQFSITAAGHITVGQDTAGTAIIKAGDNQTVVTFNVPYDTTPKIAVTIQGLPDFFYGVATKTPTGFTIQTSQPMTADTSFDWIALAQPSTSTSQSSLNQQIVVVSQPAGSGQTISESGSSGASSETISNDSSAGAPSASSTTPSDSSGQVAGTSTTVSDTTAPVDTSATTDTTNPTGTSASAPATTDTTASAPATTDTTASAPADSGTASAPAASDASAPADSGTSGQ